MMGVMSASMSARAFKFTSSLVSPNRLRRSEWPTMQKAQPMFLIMAMEISPVNAPLGSQ